MQPDNVGASSSGRKTATRALRADPSTKELVLNVTHRIRPPIRLLPETWTCRSSLTPRTGDFRRELLAGLADHLVVLPACDYSLGCAARPPSESAPPPRRCWLQERKRSIYK